MAATVRELLLLSERALRSRDLSAVAALYHPNAALHKAGASPIVGREAIAAHLAEVISRQPEDLEHEVTEEHIHLVTSDLAIVDTVGTSRSSAGSAPRQPTRRALVLPVPPCENDVRVRSPHSYCTENACRATNMPAPL